MAPNAQRQHVHEVPAEEVTSSLEAHETVASSLMTLQVAYLRWAGRLFLNWMEVLTPAWWQPAHKQPEAIHRLMRTPMQPSLDFLLAPLTLSRKLVETSLTGMQRNREPVPSTHGPAAEALREPVGSLIESEQP